ncbi:MAG TPA: protein translocase subunit SecDF [Chitinophagaceae bacterium]|nr:protein translocase subunit SecDF [Chitinophagaceae bacterium]
MQLRGSLTAVFASLLILYSLWQLSFTLFVRKHENKMEVQAREYMSATYPEAKKYTDFNDYPDSLKVLFKSRLKRLLDSTKDTRITWFGQTYSKAREAELNLGLDLQGGINVTMEVELTGLLRSMSNNSRDPQLLKALENANKQKANSDADFISLFYNEYKSLAGTGKLAGIFSAANQEQIPFDATDTKVLEVIRSEAGQAINRTYQVLRSRIDQFGVAQPNINLEEGKGIITVELPGIDDPERVRKYLQASANLQFWEVYNIGELDEELVAANQAFSDIMSGIQSVPDSANAITVKPDTTIKTTDDKLSTLLGGQTQTAESTGKNPTAAIPVKRSLGEFIQFVSPFQDPKSGRVSYPAAIGYVAIKDTAQVREYLNMDGIISKLPGDARFYYGIAERNNETGKLNDFVPLYVIKTYGADKAPIEGDAVTNASQDFEPITGNPIVQMSMNPKGGSDWATLTAKSAEKRIPIAIVLDDIVYSAPVADEKIEGGRSQIRGNFNVEEAKDLANILKVGKLPAPAKIVQEQVVGPTLGADAIEGGTKAFLISFIVIFLLMLIYYNTSGWVANIALILNMLFTVGILAGLGATLTAPGIAGLVLTIGMAVDTNVIIYERIKEELTRGKSYQQAISDGYRRSYPPVLDAHITTLLTAIILFYFGLGPVKGFATTQILGLLLSLFCGILVSRWLTDWYTSKKRHLKYFTSASRSVFKQAHFKFIEYRKYAYVFSSIVLILGVAAVFNGFHQGVEFSGGRSYMVHFENSKAVNVEQVRKDLELTFGENPVIKTIGDINQLDITTSYLINETGDNVDSLVKRKLFEGLKNHIPANISYENFDANYELGSKTVLPTISDDLKAGAKKATVIAFLLISLYIFIRFRDWRYSMGTIVALLHDVAITLAAFSFLKNVVPFPLELDQHFIAAVLTVIGFSMNDTVIVFDRIREYSNTLKGISKINVINRAINDTLSRTIMTSLTVFLVILILFIFGGEVTRGFAFAMLIGVVTGTYSSIFVAAPILVDMDRNKPLGNADDAPAQKATTGVKTVLAK